MTWHMPGTIVFDLGDFLGASGRLLHVYRNRPVTTHKRSALRSHLHFTLVSLALACHARLSARVSPTSGPPSSPRRTLCLQRPRLPSNVPTRPSAPSLLHPNAPPYPPMRYLRGLSRPRKRQLALRQRRPSGRASLAARPTTRRHSHEGPRGWTRSSPAQWCASSMMSRRR